jgi:hypothetical protein
MKAIRNGSLTLIFDLKISMVVILTFFMSFKPPLITFASGGQGAFFEKTAPLDPPQKLLIDFILSR